MHGRGSLHPGHFRVSNGANRLPQSVHHLLHIHKVAPAADHIFLVGKLFGQCTCRKKGIPYPDNGSLVGNMIVPHQILGVPYFQTHICWARVSHAMALV